MIKSLLTRRAVRVLGVATAGALLVPMLSSTPAQADPRQHTSQLVGVGSDTLTEVTNAFAGEAADKDYTPIHSDAASGRLQLTSWNGLPPGDPQDTDTCIAPKKLLNSFQRPNGSGQGRAALSRALDSGAYSAIDPVGDAACNNKSTAGLVDFARSSSLPSTTGTNITYVPFAKDALDAGAYAIGSATIPNTLSTAQITSIFTGGGSGTTIGGTLYIPCDIQSGSGTRNDWAKKVTGNSSTSGANATVSAAAALCTGSGTAGQIEENRLDQLKSRGDDYLAAHPGSSAVFLVGHTVSAFIAQQNDRSPNHIPAGTDVVDVDFGSGAIAPYTVTSGHFDASSAFYATSYGRTVYFAVSRSKLTGSSSGQFLGLKQLFRPTTGSGGVGSNGGTAEICKNTGNIIIDFGFLRLTNATVANAATNTTDCGGLGNERGLEANV